MSLQPIGLSKQGCLSRQQRLREHLGRLGLDAALLSGAHHVHYLSGHWDRCIVACGMLVPVEGPTVLISGFDAAEDTFADEKLVYESNHLCTLVDDHGAGVIQALGPKLDRLKRLGCDEPQRPWLLKDFSVENLGPTLFDMRRTKDEDEVAMIRRAIAGTEAAYARAREVLEPGITEIDVHAAMHQAAIIAVGERIGEFGNDFQAGSPGGPPRVRPVETGELMPLDIGVVVRGYTSDLCRTFAVDRKPTDAQREAHKHVVGALDFVGSTVKPGVSCRELFRKVFEMLDGTKGWRFFHHLGHGIGLACHEAPRLNPNWDDTFQVGDVFTAEPGLYGDDLRAGIRVEDDFLVTETGVERLSNFPTDL
jgi:Xaa-Pro dipeptidase